MSTQSNQLFTTSVKSITLNFATPNSTNVANLNPQLTMLHHTQNIRKASCPTHFSSNDLNIENVLVK